MACGVVLWLSVALLGAVDVSPSGKEIPNTANASISPGNMRGGIAVRVNIFLSVENFLICGFRAGRLEWQRRTGALHKNEDRERCGLSAPKNCLE
eukprot:3417554-Rhodomonas_salina.1